MRDKIQGKQKKWEDWEKQVEEEERLRKEQDTKSVSRVSRIRTPLHYIASLLLYLFILLFVTLLL